MDRILVIRHGALGDIITCLGAFAAIREHHTDAHITLLTQSAFTKMCMMTGYFDAIHVDNRPKFWLLHKFLALRNWFRRQNFMRVYDLQNSNRTCTYFKLFGPGKMPEWSGIAPGCSHPQPLHYRKKMHNFDRYADQLKLAGIPKTPLPSIDWMKGDIAKFNLPKRCALLVPGCSANAPYKRWPALNYAKLGNKLLEVGLTPIILGGPDDKDCTDKVSSRCPRAINLWGKTTMFDIGDLARHCKVIIGNDTGPMHIAAASGCPSLILFSGSHDTIRVAPKFPLTEWIECNPLSELKVDKVFAHTQQMLPAHSKELAHK